MLSANARREEIYHLAVTTGLASVEELSARFEVTASTIRRDLALLNGQGRLARTYGGAMALGAHPEASLRQRTGEAFEQKHAIARWAASVIRPGENILLDAGSTVGALAHELRGFDKLSVTTPGINTKQELADSEGIEAGVNITVGLPVIRTSVDHGTAFDIAGKAIADPRSMVEALHQAAEMATRPSVAV